ncbi:MAG: serine hydrolase domain-containing protein [Pseudonocardiaceae bacterium]
MSSQIDKVLHDAVAAGHVPNVVAVAADRNGVIYEGAAGPRAVGNDDPVTPDSHFRIMSMTKMVCTVAALQQVERGNLELAAPVDTYCPEFADLPVLEGFDADTPKLRPAASRATVNQLITHTTGLGYWFWNQHLARWHSVTGTPNTVSGSAEAFKAPLLADPGTKFIYGINADWLGKVVEAASGLSLDVCVKENITGPLGMNETSFLMNDEQVANSVPVHGLSEDGKWTAIGEVLNQRPDWWAGGHGLYSTPRDYLRFQRMVLSNGTLEGTKILESKTMDAAFTNQIGDLDFPAKLPTADPAATHDFNLGPGFKWGYGLLLNTLDVPGMRRAWSGAWTGLCNTHFWVDRTTGITGSIYSQFLPFVPQQALHMYVNFERALYASL